MDLRELKEFLNTLRPGSESAAEIWYVWAQELESCDSSNGEKADGEYKTAETFLEELKEQLIMIRDLYGAETVKKVISLADIPACPFPWELKGAAEHFARGGKIEDIPHMLENGTLEDFSDSSSAAPTASSTLKL